MNEVMGWTASKKQTHSFLTLESVEKTKTRTAEHFTAFYFLETRIKHMLPQTVSEHDTSPYSVNLLHLFHQHLPEKCSTYRLAPNSSTLLREKFPDKSLMNKVHSAKRLSIAACNFETPLSSYSSYLIISSVSGK